MGESSFAPLYFWCCACAYSASCVYKTVCLYDFLFFTDLLIAIVSIIAALKELLLVGKMILVAIALLYTYLAFKGIILFCTYKSNVADGSIYNKTLDHLKIRKIFVCGYFLVALLIPGLLILFCFIAISADTSMDDTAKSVARGGILVIASILAAPMLASSCFHWGFQKSLEEANNIISGKGPDGGLAQQGY